MKIPQTHWTDGFKENIRPLKGSLRYFKIIDAHHCFSHIFNRYIQNEVTSNEVTVKGNGITVFA